MNATHSDTRPMALLAIAATVIGAGGFIGATTNAINGAISPTYFQSVMPWDGVDSVWRASVALGVFAGLNYGVFFALVFTLVVGVASKAQCKYTVVLGHLLRIGLGVYGCWAAGGLIAMGLAALSPDFFQRTFIRVPQETSDMLRYAWVGGSIWGVMAGGTLALVIGSILFAVRWRRAHGTQTEATAA